MTPEPIAPLPTANGRVLEVNGSVGKRPALGLRTLCIDIGGTGLKALLVNGAGTPMTERARVETPRPATPEALLRAITSLIAPLGAFDRVSAGFPGVVLDGVIKTAPNLDPSWDGFPLAKALGDITHRPVRVLNDAGVQGYGVIKGNGVEMLLTLGTGMGCALFVDGTYVPNLELAHHPFRKGKTYEENVGAAALERFGKKKWNHRLALVLETVLRTFNPQQVYLGGGNAKHVTIDLPPGVTLTSNVAGLTGGFALWSREAHRPHAGPAAPDPVAATVAQSASAAKNGRRNAKPR